MRRELLIAEIQRTVWALEPSFGNNMIQVLERWRTGAPMSEQTADQIRADRQLRDARRGDAARTGNGSIAVIPVYGVLTQRGNMVDDISGPGSCSTEMLATALRQTEADQSIGQILLDFDTPGGSVYGIQELAAEINRIKASKPVIGISNSLCASAGYWLLAQCTEAYCTPGGEVGSIGVWQAHQDMSKAYEKAGVSTTLISAGKYKTEGHGFGPLPSDAKAFMQSRTDDYYAAFTDAVAKGRKVPVAKVRGGMGQGRVLGADAALAEKMIDGIGTLQQVASGMLRGMRPGGGRSALAIDPEVAAARARREAQMRRLELETIESDVQIEALIAKLENRPQ